MFVFVSYTKGDGRLFDRWHGNHLPACCGHSEFWQRRPSISRHGRNAQGNFFPQTLQQT